MPWSYAIHPGAVPSLLPLLFLIPMGIHCLQNRKVPGAVPFILLIGLTILWIAANILGLSATDDPVRIFWFKFEKTLVLPIASTALCFVLVYAGMSRWLTRWVIGVLMFLPLMFALLILTDGVHHLVWRHMVTDGIIHAEIGPAYRMAIVYGYALGLVQLGVLIRLFVNSPRHRWIAAGLVLGLISMRAASYINLSGNHPFKPVNFMLVTSNVTFLLYALAFFRLRMFELVPVARNLVIDRMMGAMIVLDAQKFISDLNERAEILLDLPRKKTIGRPAASALAAFPEITSLIETPQLNQQELSFGNPPSRWYHISISPLKDRHEFPLGYLLWMQDITGQKQVQEQLMDNLRTHAMLQEREMLGRELHDGIGQILAAAQLLIASTSTLLSRGETDEAALYLRRLSETIQKAKDAVRNYLAGIQPPSPSGKDFLEALKNTLDRYSRNHDTRINLDVTPEVRNIRIDSAVAAQIHPIVMEALTNVRRHSHASLVKVTLTTQEGRLCLTIEDNGQGFDPAEISQYDSFGLRSMAGRATSTGGCFEIASIPGIGTRVSVQVPWREEAA